MKGLRLKMQKRRWNLKRNEGSSKFAANMFGSATQRMSGFCGRRWQHMYRLAYKVEAIGKQCLASKRRSEHEKRKSQCEWVYLGSYEEITSATVTMFSWDPSLSVRLPLRDTFHVSRFFGELELCDLVAHISPWRFYHTCLSSLFPSPQYLTTLTTSSILAIYLTTNLTNKLYFHIT